MGIQISAVIITYNEEKNIKRCLDSLQKIADEIIDIRPKKASGGLAHMLGE